jgi:hypothetical protein
MDESGNGKLPGPPSESVREAPLLMSCSRCETLHPFEDPREFDPVCPTCAGSHPMGELEMSGPYLLTDGAIDRALNRTSAGNYALGYMDGAAFLVFYVGRADSDVKRRLHDWVGASSRFERYAPSAQAASGSRQRGPLPLGAPALERVGIGVDSAYTCFAFSYAVSARAAFEKECRNYHDFGAGAGLDNEAHPAPTLGSSWECLAHDR